MISEPERICESCCETFAWELNRALDLNHELFSTARKYRLEAARLHAERIPMYQMEERLEAYRKANNELSLAVSKLKDELRNIRNPQMLAPMKPNVQIVKKIVYRDRPVYMSSAKDMREYHVAADRDVLDRLMDLTDSESQWH